MGQTFVLLLREGLEASLIVGILLAYLVSIRRTDQAPSIWLGVLAAVAVSVGVAALLFFTASEFEGRAEEIYEGVASLTAVGVLTWMVFWMRRHAVNIKRSLQEKVQEALNSPSKLGLAAIAFVMVVREGIETALFLFATVKQTGASSAMVGGLLGLAAAIGLGVAIFKGGVRMNLSLFFTSTGAILLVVAAGLFAYGLHELIEAGVVPSVIEHVWSTKSFLPDSEGAGAFLKTFLGYNDDPALTELLAWAGYLLICGVAFFKPVLRVRKAALAAQQA